jgi:hypothetical protein
MVYVALAVAGAVVVVAVGLNLRERHRNAPLRREMRTQPIAFRTELYRVRFPDPPWWGVGGEVRGRLELIIRGDLVRVGAPFGLVMFPQCYFRAPETTIELSRNPPRIYGIDSRREWIVVRGRQDGREFELAMTRRWPRYFLDDVWNALVAAGAVPASGGPPPRTGRNGLSG